MRRPAGILRVALVFAVLLASLSLVVHRQSRALELLRALDTARNDIAALEAERAELTRRLQKLNSRAYVVRAAGERLGMHVPAGAELVILRMDEAQERDVGPPGALALAGRKDAATP